MTLPELLEKLKSNEKRDALAERDKQAEADFRFHVYPDANKDIYTTFQADVACSGFQAAIDYVRTEHGYARTKDLEVVIKALEKCIAQRTAWANISRMSDENIIIMIEHENKELEAILKGEE